MTDRPTPPASKRAREALAAAEEAEGFTAYAKWLRDGTIDRLWDDAPDEPSTALRAIDTATSTLLDEIEARVRGLKMKLRANQDAEEQHWAHAHNAAIDEALAEIGTIQGRE